MSKKKWLLTILILAFIGYLIVSKVNPAWGYGVDKVAGGFVGNVKSGIEASPIWQQYDIWFSGAFFSIVTALILWQGHNAFNKVRGMAVQSAVKESGYQQRIPSPSPGTIIVEKEVPVATEPTPSEVAVTEEQKT